MIKNFIVEEINRIKEIMGLSETMKPKMSNKFTKRDYWNAIIVSIDENNDIEHYLILTVNLMPLVNNFDYTLTYGFSVHNINGEKVSHYLYNRDEVAKYLPVELKGKISPMVLIMIEDLVNRIKPQVIHMITEEILSGNSLKRYDNIIDLLVNKLGYAIKESGVNALGKNYWVLIDGDKKEITIDESYQLNEDEIRRLEIDEFVTKNLTVEVVLEMISKQ